MDMQDRQQILDLISGYSYGYDGQDWDLFESLWADEAVLKGGPTTRRGPAEIVAGFRARRERLAAEGVQTRHYQTNTLLSDAGGGRVMGRSLLLVAWQRAGEPAPVVRHTGVYTDEFFKTGAGWRIVSRTVDIDHD